MSCFVLPILISLLAWFALRLYISGWQMDRWTMSKFTVLLGSLCVQIFALISLWLMGSFMILKDFRQSQPGLHLPLDLLALGNDQGRGGHDPQNIWKERLPLIFGRSLWTPDTNIPFSIFGGFSKCSRRIFIAFRAILALVIFLGMLIFAIFCLIISPTSETGMVPVKTMISPGVQGDFQALSPGWNVFVVCCHFQ